MARVRLYIPTYKRHRLLPRALKSLQNQSFTDWVAEVHNDAPGDPVPAELVRQLKDERIHIIEHPCNLGGTATFNLFFAGCAEPYISILEDDNWWESSFLETMLAAMKDQPSVSLAWSNMRIWREESDGTWTDTGQLVWPGETDSPSRLVTWGDPRQAFGALHSNGAMLVRSSTKAFWLTPPVEPAAVEPFRERAVPHPMLFVAKPLANFSVTRLTHRRDDRRTWATLQTLLAATFAESWATTADRIEELWRYARAQPQRMTDVLLLASFQDRSLAHLRQPARLFEWIWLAAASMRRPAVAWHVSRARQENPTLWDFLQIHTRRRVEEASLIK